MHTLYLCVHCVVWLVFLDPQCSIYHAETPTQQERSGQCEFDRWEPSWSRALQLAPGGRLGPQPIPREWSRKSTQTTVRTLSNLSTDTPPKQSKVWYIWYISQDALLCFRMYFFFPSFFLVAFLQAKKPITSHSFCSCTWECILMSTSQRNRWRMPWQSSGRSWQR